MINWAGILVGVGIAVALYWVVEPLDRWIGIPGAHHFLTILVIAAGSALTCLRVQRSDRQSLQSRLALFREVSHQLRTPITSIVAYTDLLRERPPQDAATRDRFLNTLAAEARRLTNLVDDVLALMRLDPALPNWQGRQMDLSQLARAVVDELAPVAANRGIALSAWIDRATPPVVGDPELLRQLLTNLVDNAIKYNRPHGRVRVGLRPDGGATVMTVSDTGPGIAPEDRAHLFQEFYRGRQLDGIRRHGSGLGLAIVRRIAVLHGGSVDVQSEPGCGSIFTVRLPVEPATVRGLGPGRAASWRWLAMGWARSRWMANDVREVEVKAG